MKSLRDSQLTEAILKHLNNWTLLDLPVANTLQIFTNDRKQMTPGPKDVGKLGRSGLTKIFLFPLRETQTPLTTGQDFHPKKWCFLKCDVVDLRQQMVKRYADMPALIAPVKT